jgi:cytochrome c oxidase subunit 2
MKAPALSRMIKWTASIAVLREFLPFARATLRSWWRAHAPAAKAEREVVLWADSFNDNWQPTALAADGAQGAAPGAGPSRGNGVRLERAGRKIPGEDASGIADAYPAAGRTRRSSVCSGGTSASRVPFNDRKASVIRLTWAGLPCAALLIVAAGCSGIQSALDPAGRDAERIAGLFWGLLVLALLIWAGVTGLSLYAYLFRRTAMTLRHARLLVIAGGVAFPVVVLLGILTYSLSMIPEILAPAPEGSLRIHVSGEQWWWRVRYLRDGGDTVELANEIRFPVDEPVNIELEAPDVIHSFWIPSLAGKMDMIPGRLNSLRLHPIDTGVFRGVCAEYCGTSHALMSFMVVVTDSGEFLRWLDAQAAPAQAPQGATAIRGSELFLENGCGACHAIRGTAAAGVIGPDLTHVGSRLSLGAGILPSDTSAFLRWIEATHVIKPGVHMPAFGMLPREDLRALAIYLEGLK